jgi:hypothetical protein
VKSIDINKEFKRAVQVLKLDASAMTALAKDKNATPVAIFLIVFSSFAGALGSIVFPMTYGPVTYRPALFEAFSNMVVSVGLVFLMLVVLNFFADRLFKGKSDFESLIRVVGYGYLIGVLNFFPVLSALVGIWLLIVFVYAMKTVKGLSFEQAVLNIIMVIVLLVGLFMLVQGLNPANIYGGLYLAPY